MSDSPRPVSRPKNSFEFVTVASARARQLLEGCTPKVDGSPKLARRALQEVTSGAVTRAGAEGNTPDELDALDAG
jgi:DNA-directed RNA polymerase subunit K/omega